MEVTGGAEEGFVREWTPCSHILNLIPTRIQAGIFSSELCLTCVDAVSEFIALGTNLGLVYWYDRKKGNIQRLRCEATTSPITYVKIVSTVDYMVGAGNAEGQVTVFQIPKEHPENVPDTFKPKVEPKVERYTIGDLHKSEITAIEWSKNGMRLFSGDKNGVIIMTEIDFYMHLCKSSEMVNEEHEIVQLSCYQGALLVSTVYRSIVCERRDARWHVAQLGKQERKSLCRLGAVFHYSYARGGGGAAAAYCARPGLRLWRADRAGEVQQTMLFKEAISNPLTVAELLNPSPHKQPSSEREQLGPLHVFRDHFLVSHSDRVLYILDPRSLTAVAVVDDLRRILSVSVNKDEIFVLEGPRSLLRLAHAPEPAAHAEDPVNVMSKSLTTSLQHAVSTVRDLTLDQTVPYITSVIETTLFKTDTETAVAEECFELPPIKHLPQDISDNVLVSIINEFKDVTSDIDEIRRIKSEELQKKLKLYNSIMEKGCEGEVIHSRRGRRREGREGGSGGATPRLSTPVRKPDVSYTTPCLMNVSVYSNMPQPNDDLLEKQIEEKEKILAKMLNLESLSIETPKLDIEPTKEEVFPTYTHRIEDNVFIQPKESPKPITVKPISKPDPNLIDLVPNVVKLPNNWNLEKLQLKLEIQSNGIKNARNLLSPDDNLDEDWEII